MRWLLGIAAFLAVGAAVIWGWLTHRKGAAKDQELAAGFDRAEQLEKEKAAADEKIAADEAKAAAEARVKAAQEKAKGAAGGNAADTLRRLGR